jgi:hypothetical protein
MDDFKSDIFFDLFGFIVWIPACAGMTEEAMDLVFTRMTE